LIYVAFGLWGIFAAFQSPAMEALFADSVPKGQRSLPFTLKHVTQNTALVIGPLCGILLFLHYGDSWALPELRGVILFGSFLAAISMISLFYFNDDLAYENIAYEHAVERNLRSIGRHFDVEYSDYTMEEELMYNHQGESYRHDATISSQANGDKDSSEKSSLLTTTTNTTTTSTPNGPSTLISMYTAQDSCQTLQEDSILLQVSSEYPTFCGLEPEHVPYILFVADFVISNGAGMSINFFALFFYKEFGLTPIQVQILFALQPICVAICSFLSQLLSKTCGRMPIIILTRLLGTFCLLLMSKMDFLLRAAFMRCTEPLRRSILMDFVPKKHRARWNSLEGLSMFTWAGSAVVGGFLVDAHGYRYCFFITAMVYFIGVTIEALLIPITSHVRENYSSPTEPGLEANSTITLATKKQIVSIP
jgi:MFS family permease